MEEKWRRKPRAEDGTVRKETPAKITFSEEVLALKKLLDAKLVCQHRLEHRFEKGKWYVNSRTVEKGTRDERYHRPEWELCETCNC